MTDKINLLNLNQKELEDLVISLGMKKFYGKQIFNWLHKTKGNFKGKISKDELLNNLKSFLY